MNTDASIAALKGRFTPHHDWDRNFFLAMMLTIWVGILMGFGTDIARHYKTDGLNYPLIVHVHAAAFVGWLVLLTTQILLIRNRNYALHMKLGLFGACLAAIMVVLGPLTEILVSRLYAKSPDSDPAFMIVAFTGMTGFGVMTASALLLRKNAAAHKRLMLLGTLAISSAGFARWLGQAIAQLLGHSPYTFWAALYLVTSVLVIAIGVYDLVTRRRLVPTYVIGAACVLALQVFSAWMYASPAWLVIARHIVGV